MARIAFFSLLVISACGAVQSSDTFEASHNDDAGASALSLANATSNLHSCTLMHESTVTQLQAMIASGCTRVVIDTDATVNIASADAIVVPSTVTLVFNTGARWDIAEGTDVQILGSYDIPLTCSQVFFGGGSVTTAAPIYVNGTCPTALRVAYPEWFGASVGPENDYSAGADDSVAISKALLFGDRVELAAGNYHLKNRLVLARHQTLAGVGLGVTRLSQMPNANLVQYPSQAWDDFKLQDFIVGLASDCTSVTGLSILGLQLNNPRMLSNVYEATGDDILVAGIQISSHMGWVQPPLTPQGERPEDPIKQIVVSDVEVHYAYSSCINIQSDRAATDVLITGVICNARTGGNTSGLTIEAFHPTYANRFQRITVKKSSFTGGSWGLYFAGVTDLVLDEVTVHAAQGAYSAALFYTSDAGHPITARVTNSTFSLMKPTSVSTAVIELAGRGYVKDRDEDFPFLNVPPLGALGNRASSLVIDGSTIISAEHPASVLVPLIFDNIGFESPVELRATSLIGGSKAIFAGDPHPALLTPHPDPTQRLPYGGRVYEQAPVKGDPTIVRDVKPDELASHGVHHSSFHISLCRFYRQQGSSIKLSRGSLRLFDTTFYDIGKSPAFLDAPIVDLGAPSPDGPWTAPQHRIQHNGYSGVNATAFLRLPATVLTNNTRWGSNSSFATSQSRPAGSMESIRAY